MNRLLRIPGLSVATLTVILAAGCGGDAGSISPETDDASYREGQQLERQGRADEALAAYLKVIARRGDAAPESHLDAGILYLNHIKDPITAIYHFRKYLELMPNSRQAANVRGEIAAATREFARTLPGQPMDSQAARLGLGDEIESLRRENDELRAEVAAMRDGVAAAPAAHVAAAGSPAAEGLLALPAIGGAAAGSPGVAGEISDPAAVDALSAPVQGPASTAGRAAPPGWARVSGSASDTASALGPALAAVGAAATGASARLPMGAAVTGSGAARTSASGGAASARSAPPAAGRRHTVVKGDTLSNLSQKYYGTRSKWRDLLAANRDLLSGPNDLKIGMELRVP
jgi:LysM repeat protein